jgi:hypothetical protein
MHGGLGSNSYLFGNLAKAAFFVFLFASFCFPASMSVFFTYQQDHSTLCDGWTAYLASCGLTRDGDLLTFAISAHGQSGTTTRQLPAGSGPVTNVSTTGSFFGTAGACSWSGNEHGGRINCPGCVGNVHETSFHMCTVTFDVDGVQTLPQCSDLLPVEEPRCEGGTGVWVAGNNAAQVPGWSAGYIAHEFTWYNPAPVLIRSDGSECFSGFDGICEPGYDCAYVVETTVCPNGLAQSSSSAESPSSASQPEQSSASQSSSGSFTEDICREFPELCATLSSGTGGSAGSGIGGSCTDLSNCDWSKLNVQLRELGVAVEIREKIRQLIDVTQYGYRITEEQSALLNSIIGAVNEASNANSSGTSDVVNAINGLASGLGGSGSISDGVAEGMGKFYGDTAGRGEFDGWAGSEGDLDGWLGGTGDGGGQMGDSLGNGMGARNKINRAVGIKGEDLHFLGTGGACPVFDASFDSGVMGISCSNCRVDLCNVYGFNFGAFLKTMLWLSVMIVTLAFDLEVLRKGGN